MITRLSEKETFNLCQLVAAGATREQALQVIEQQRAARAATRPTTVRRTRVPAEGPLRGENRFHQPYRVAGTTSLSPKALIA